MKRRATRRSARVALTIPQGFATDAEKKANKTTRLVSQAALNKAGSEARYWLDNYRDRLRKQYTAGKMSEADYRDQLSTLKDLYKNSTPAYSNANGTGFRGFYKATSSQIVTPANAIANRYNTGLSRAYKKSNLSAFANELRRLGLASTQWASEYIYMLDHEDEYDSEQIRDIIEAARVGFNAYQTAQSARQMQRLDKVGELLVSGLPSNAIPKPQTPAGFSDPGSFGIDFSKFKK